MDYIRPYWPITKANPAHKRLEPGPNLQAIARNNNFDVSDEQEFSSIQRELDLIKGVDQRSIV